MIMLDCSRFEISTSYMIPMASCRKKKSNRLISVNQIDRTTMQSLTSKMLSFFQRGLERETAVESVPFRSGTPTASTSNDLNKTRKTSDVLQQKMAKSTGVLIGTDLNCVQFSSQVANALQEETASINSKKEGNDFDMVIESNEQSKFLLKFF